MIESVYAGVDIGGSHIGFGLVKSDGTLLKPSIHVPVKGISSVSDLIDLIYLNINNMLSGESVKLIGVGVGSPGQTKNGLLVAASNILPGQMNIPIVKLLSEAFDSKVPVVLINDADASLAAEVFSQNFQAKYRGIKSAAILTLGTGVGFSLFLDGKLYEGSNGLLEAGHMIVSKDLNDPCGCGQNGCAELYASASKVAQRYARLAGVPDADIGAKDVFDKYAKGDAIAARVLDEATDVLGILCVNICRVVDPDVIILAGGMSQAGDMLVSMVQQKMMARSWKILPTDVKIVIATTNASESGIFGAALAIKNALLCGDAKPTNSQGWDCKYGLSVGLVVSVVVIAGLIISKSIRK